MGVEQTFTLDIEMTEATPCTLEGKVTDKKTGSPLSGVMVEIQPIGKKVQTAQDGTYLFDSLKVRKYTLKAQKEGYVDYIQEEMQLVADQTTTVDIEMEEPFVEFRITDEKTGYIIKEMGCGIESRFKLKNVGNIAGEWRMEWEADWITEISPTSGNLVAGLTETITIKKKLQEEDKETVLTIKTDKDDLHWKVVSKGVAGIELVYVEGGTFEMGATTEQSSDAYDNEKPVRTIKLDGYHIGKYEVMQAQWKAVMGTDPSQFKGDNLPVELVSWEEAQEFCKKLSEATGKKYVLPTEAQWEYAARGGNQSQHYKYAGSNDIDEVAWYSENSDNKTHPVGTKKANELGIYDMSGNVFEWCSDRYADQYDENDTDNPQGPSSGFYRVVRDGSCQFDRSAVDYRVSVRRGAEPGWNIIYCGFRVAVLP
ncbi:MAG: SUMF1/EgtB/PvdO family nonheme iron enzyme [Bacteroidales bacterium]|nr:SUMF1/EgtB/PvdO family nonheme iron enzyme [Bacteroidales bacterium]